jgi:hypothetical protein
MAIKTSVCGVKGHDIASVVARETQIPGTAIMARQYEILCVQCGASLEEIRKELKSRSGTSQRDRKAKAAASAPPAENPVEVHQ